MSLTREEAVTVPVKVVRDRWPLWVALVSAILSVASYLVTRYFNAALLYKDAISHMEIARRVVSGTSEGAAQLGSVWLPLPHVLMLPLIWSDTLYYSGLAGSVISMIAYAAASVYMYLTVRDLATTRLAGAVTALIFMVNVNVLYMQSVPMTESLLFCTLIASVYYFQRFALRNMYVDAVRGSVWAALASLTRYESWPIVVCLMLGLLVTVWCRSPRPKRLERVMAYAWIMGMISFCGIVGWMLWGLIIFGSPLSFQNGEYAKPSLWVGDSEPAVGNLTVAFKTYWLAMLDTVGLPTLGLGAIGLMLFIYIGLFRRQLGLSALPVLSLLVTVPFFVAALYAGQRPLHVMQISSELYNVRFGLVVLLPVAIFAAYSVRGAFMVRRSVGYLAVVVMSAVMLTTSVFAVYTGSVATYQEPYWALTQVRTVEQQEVNAFLNKEYDGGPVLMESFGNELIAFYGVPSDQLVYEGSYRQWEPSLGDPAGNGIRWIVTYGGSDGPDKVSRRFAEAPSGYHEVFHGGDGNYRVYKQN